MCQAQKQKQTKLTSETCLSAFLNHPDFESLSLMGETSCGVGHSSLRRGGWFIVCFRSQIWASESFWEGHQGNYRPIYKWFSFLRRLKIFLAYKPASQQLRWYTSQNRFANLNIILGLSELNKTKDEKSPRVAMIDC